MHCLLIQITHYERLTLSFLSYQVTYRSLMVTCMVLGSLTAFGAVLAFHLFPPVYAKPIDHATDVIAHEMRSKQRPLSLW